MRLKDEIVEKLKRHAAERGMTPEAVIEAALAKEIDLKTPVARGPGEGAEVFSVTRRRRHPLD